MLVGSESILCSFICLLIANVLTRMWSVFGVVVLVFFINFIAFTNEFSLGHGLSAMSSLWICIIGEGFVLILKCGIWSQAIALYHYLHRALFIALPYLK